MAQFNAQYDPRKEKYGQMGDVLGMALGGLGGYALQQYQLPGKIKEMVDSGYFTPEEAKFAVHLPPQQLSQIVQKKMQLQKQQQENAAIANIFGGGRQQQPDFSSIPGGNIADRLGGLGNMGGPNVSQQSSQAPTNLFSPEQEQEFIKKTQGMSNDEIDAVLNSPNIPMDKKNQIYGILDKQRANKFKEKTQAENMQFRRESLEQKAEMPQRTQMIKDVAEIEKAGRNASNEIAEFKNIKAAAKNPELRTGLWKQGLDAFGFGEFAQSPISFVVDKMIADINFSSLSNTTTSGKVTAALLKETAKRNPSLFSEPEGIEAMADLKIYSAKIKETVQKEIDKIRDKAPRGVLPLDTISKAHKAAKPKIKALHEKELKVVERLNKNEIKQDIKQLSELNAAHNPSKLPNGAIGRDESGKIVAKVENGVWRSV